jgi:hypothetical protein
MWYFGHFHINRKFLIGETKFRCFAEMARFEVVSCDSSVLLRPVHDHDEERAEG